VFRDPNAHKQSNTEILFSLSDTAQKAAHPYKCHHSLYEQTVIKTKMLLSPFLTLTILLFFSSSSSSSVSAIYSTPTCSNIVPFKNRTDRISITDYGGVGDGRTLNTKAFREAVYRIEHLKRPGGTVLYVPQGVYVTESFNLTSHMTLYLAAGAVIKAQQVRLTRFFQCSSSQK